MSLTSLAASLYRPKLLHPVGCLITFVSIFHIKFRSLYCKEGKVTNEETKDHYSCSLGFLGCFFFYEFAFKKNFLLKISGNVNWNR